MFSRLIYGAINISMKGSIGLKNNCLRVRKMALKLSF